MKAVVFEEKGRLAVREVAEPTIQEPGDAILRVTASAICGSDLHAYHGRIRGMTPGTVMGHEYVGEVVDVGAGVVRFKPGDRVFGSFFTACGRCWACRRAEFSQCEYAQLFGFGPNFGDLPGTQAQFARIPFADVTLHPLPPAVGDDAGLFLGDTLATAYFAVSRARVRAGDRVAVIGAGPVGLLAIMSARVFGAAEVFALDLDPERLRIAESYGARPLLANPDALARIRDATQGRGADAVIEAVGSATALSTAFQAARGFATVSAAGVFTEREAPVPLGRGFAKDLTLALGMANVIAAFDAVVALVEAGRLDPTPLVSHRLPLDGAPEGYRLFDEKKALKVMLRP